MKTENEKFALARLLARKQFLYELADLAREEADKATTARAAFNGDVETYAALRQKEMELLALFGEASRKAYDAERAAYYASRAS